MERSDAGAVLALIQVEVGAKMVVIGSKMACSTSSALRLFGFSDRVVPLNTRMHFSFLVLNLIFKSIESFIS
jgi:hypothetical protein